jgi:hypothetical protein
MACMYRHAGLIKMRAALGFVRAKYEGIEIAG